MLRYWSSFFFFSSRRRHTRCSRDWSSDVCSSDLPCPAHSQTKSSHTSSFPDFRPRKESAGEGFIGPQACASCHAEKRSEEHTSELQSRLHLVCRLLLEKKKKHTHTHIQSSHLYDI